MAKPLRTCGIEGFREMIGVQVMVRKKFFPPFFPSPYLGHSVIRVTGFKGDQRVSDEIATERAICT